MKGGAREDSTRIGKGGAVKKVLAKAQMGLNYGIPNSGTTNYSAPTMRKGGTHKMPNGKIMLNSKMQKGGTTTTKKISSKPIPWYDRDMDSDALPMKILDKMGQFSRYITGTTKLDVISNKAKVIANKAKVNANKVKVNSKMKVGGTTTTKNGSAVEKIKTAFNAGSTTKKISTAGKEAANKVKKVPKLDPLRSGPAGIDPKRWAMRKMGLEHVAEKVLETGSKMIHYFDPKFPVRSFKQAKIKKKTLAQRAASLPSSKKQKWINQNKQ